MSSNVLAGLVGLKIRRVSVASAKASAKTEPEAEFITVVGPVGGTHHLVQDADADHASVLSNNELEKFWWFENRTDAEAAFLHAIADE
jgi:hypothetical protein